MDDPGSARRKKEQTPEPPPPPPPPTFSAEELEQTRAKAYAEGEAAGQQAGFQRGQSQAFGEIEAALALATERMGADLERLLADRDALNEDRAGQPLRIALAVIDKLLPSLIHHHGKEELEAFITTCLNEAIDEPKLVIRLNETLLEPMRARIDELATARGFEGRLVILGTPDIGLGDARIEWAEGGAERNTAQLLADITAAAERMLSGAPVKDAETPDDHHG